MAGQARKAPDALTVYPVRTTKRISTLLTNIPLPMVHPMNPRSLLTPFLLAGALLLPGLASADTLPNIVIVLADDLGWGDPQCYQKDSKIPTPHMDRLAREGLRFTDAHTPSSVCTPTRYTLLTGRYAWRTRLTSGVLDGFDPPLINPENDTIASLLKRKGYQTHCIGKWHLGMQWTNQDGSLVIDRESGFRQGAEVDYTQAFKGGPLDVGFDTYYGISASLDMSPYCWLRGNRVVEIPTIKTEENRDGMFMNQVPGMTTEDFRLEDVLPGIAAESVKVIHEASAKDAPFFCYIPLTSPHLPVVPSDDFVGKSQVGPYGDFVMETDHALGQILQALDDTDEAENTLVLFTSDNGGLFHYWDFRAADDGGKAPRTPRGEQNRQFNHQSNADWRGTKADIFEGGHRVTFLIRWPAQAEGGQVIEETVELTDMFATVAEIVEEHARGVSGMDSFSLLPLITGESYGTDRPFAIHHSLRGHFAIRQGDWKLIDARGSGGFTKPNIFKEVVGPEGQLYNLGEDPQETTNLWESQPERVQSMRDLLQAVKSGSACQVAGQ